MEVLANAWWWPFGDIVVLVLGNPPANAGDIRDMGLTSGSEGSFGGGHGSPCQYSCLESPMDKRAWWIMIRGVTKNRTQLKWLSMQA